jgi:hypothetical protein
MHPHRKLGRHPRAHANIPHLSQLRRVAHPDIPAAKTWLDTMPDNLGMMLNDRLGCCSISALHHARQIWTFWTGAMITDADSCTEADYEAFCGYVPGNPNTDRGGNLQEVLSLVMRNGLTTAAGPDKPLAFVEVDPRIPQDIREVIALGGVVYLGIDVLDSWTEADAGGVWDKDSSPVAGGHAVIAAGYDAQGFDIISWGMRFKMTPRAFAGYCDEAYWIANRNWIRKTSALVLGLDPRIDPRTPGGLTENDLAQAMQGVRIAA